MNKKKSLRTEDLVFLKKGKIKVLGKYRKLLWHTNRSMEKAIDTADNETLSLNDLSPVSEIGYVHIHYENLPMQDFFKL